MPSDLDSNEEADRSFDDYVRRTSEMYRHTRNHLVNSYWQSLAESSAPFLPFVLRGSLQWESLSKGQVYAPDQQTWLLSRLYDPVGKHIGANPVQLYLQWDLNLYEIWGGVPLPPLPQASESAFPQLSAAVGEVSLLTDLASLLTGASLQWLPARWSQVRLISTLEPNREAELLEEWQCVPLQRDADEGVTTVVDDSFVSEGLLPLFAALRSIPGTTRGLLARAIGWHAAGNYRGSGMSSATRMPPPGGGFSQS